MKKDSGEFKFSRGATLRDVITGFTGVVTGRADYITGCAQYLLQPTGMVDGKKADTHWFDEQRLVLENTKVVQLDEQANAKTPGSDRQAPTK